MPSNTLAFQVYESTVLKHTFWHSTGFATLEKKKRCLSRGDDFCNSREGLKSKMTTIPSLLACSGEGNDRMTIKLLSSHPYIMCRDQLGTMIIKPSSQYTG